MKMYVKGLAAEYGIQAGQGTEDKSRKRSVIEPDLQMPRSRNCSKTRLLKLQLLSHGAMAFPSIILKVVGAWSASSQAHLPPGGSLAVTSC